MSRNLAGGIIALAGLVIIAVFVLADVIGIGSGDSLSSDGFGPRQIVGTVVGIVVLIVGVAVYMRSSGAVGAE